MCGIVGLVGSWQNDLLDEMSMSLAHRGPDDSKAYADLDAEVSIGVRRLSILDLDTGDQPIPNEDETIWVALNGEIFNSPELRPFLEGRGHRFRTSHSDTECLLHLYEEKGEAMVADLNGMYAFVIYDQTARRLFGARDRFGIKPLYYTKPQGRFAFASELKTLLLLPSIPRDVNMQSLYHYLSLRYVPDSNSIFEAIKRVPPAHYFVYDIDRQTLELTRYWRPTPSIQEGLSIEEWTEIIRDEMRAAVTRWVLSDVPVACSLSGGLDSTSIVGLLAESGYPRVRTYSVGFDQPEEAQWNELALARKMAQRWDTEHHELILAPEDILNDLLPMVWHLEEPYGGGLPSWFVFKFMGEDVKVGLTGTGGDELFGDYGKWQRYERTLPDYSPSGFGRRLRHRVGRVALDLPKWVLGDKRRSNLAGESANYRHPMDAYKLYFDDSTKRSEVIRFAPDGMIDTADWLQRVYEESSCGDIRNGFTCVDLQTQLPEEFLFMTDRFSMAFSVEARVPFLDHLFVERMLGIPSHIRTREGDLKYLLRRAVAPLLPAELLTEPKHGFVIPDTIWLRGQLRPLVERLLSPVRLADQGLFKPSIYERFIRPHLEGRADFTGQVWTLLMFQLWHLVFVEEAAETSPTYSLDDLA